MVCRELSIATEMTGADFGQVWRNICNVAHSRGVCLVEQVGAGVEYMIRSELVRLVSEAFPGLTHSEIDAVVTAFFEDIIAQLASGGRVEIRGFGAFTTRARAGRTGRNPRTGSAVEVQPKRVMHFKPGKELRARINS